MSDNPDVKLLLEAVVGRLKFPRACTYHAYEKVHAKDRNTTEKIFLEHGGLSAWLAYVVTKRFSESTAHACNKAKRQRLIKRLDTQTPIEARRILAAQVAAAIRRPERDRLEQVIRTARLRPDRPDRQPQSRTSPETDEKPNEQQTEDARDASAAGAPGQNRSQSANDPQPWMLWEPEEPRLVLEEHPVYYATVAECRRLFPPYMAAAIRRKAGPEDEQEPIAAMSISPEGVLQLELANNKVEHVARELFGAHVETADGFRYIYLQGTTKAMPNPSLVLKGGRPPAIRELLGTPIAEAVFATSAYQSEVRDGRGDSTDCVTMTIPHAASDSAEVCVLLTNKEADLLRANLCDEQSWVVG